VSDVHTNKPHGIQRTVLKNDGSGKRDGIGPRMMMGSTKEAAVMAHPVAECMGIAEGIETALSATALDGVPVWAALNTSLLIRFAPPDGVTTLRIYADRDIPGLKAAGHLMERLQGQVSCELRVPSAPYKDFNDQLISSRSCQGPGAG
jgi:putative DNA primase/helicase